MNVPVLYIYETLNFPPPSTVVLAPLTLIFKHTTRTDKVAPLVSGVTGHAQLPDDSHYPMNTVKNALSLSDTSHFVLLQPQVITSVS